MPVPIDSGDIFRLRNDSETEELVIPATQTYKAYRIPPGKTGLVPFEPIRVWWGDPRCKPQVMTRFRDSSIRIGEPRGFINTREDELRRLGVLYGSYASDVQTLLDPEYQRGSPHFGETKRVPHPISVQTESGDPIVPLCFDLTGDTVYPAVDNSTESLTDEVAYRTHLEKRLDEMKAELNRISGASDDAEVDVGR
jgi:hypothetical protein